MANRYKDRTIEERLLTKVEKTSSCWLFRGCLDTYGYGLLSVKGSPRTTHRLAWELWKGPIPENLCVLHECDVRNCVNPEHLFLGTHNDNMLDKAAKGRSRTGPRDGEANPLSKLTEVTVREIRRLFTQKAATQTELAKRFNVTVSTIGRVVHNQAWRHV